jgi:hypothetical protein
VFPVENPHTFVEMALKLADSMAHKVPRSSSPAASRSEPAVSSSSAHTSSRQQGQPTHHPQPSTPGASRSNEPGIARDLPEFTHARKAAEEAAERDYMMNHPLSALGHTVLPDEARRVLKETIVNPLRSTTKKVVSGMASDHTALRAAQETIEADSQLQQHMSSRLERVVFSLQRVNFAETEPSVTQENEDIVMMAVAELKSIKDILAGRLPA